MAGAPQLVQVAGHAAGGVDHDRIRARELVDRSDQLALAGQRGMADGEDALDLGFPLGVELLGRAR